MKYTLFRWYLPSLALLCSTNWLAAQTPTDAIMMNQRQSCIALVYEHSSFDEYWEGALLRKNGTIETVNRN